MEPVERIVRVSAPLDLVWRIFSEVDELPRRMRHVVEVQRLSGPAFGVGTRWRHTARPHSAPDTRVASDIEVTGCEPQKFFVLQMQTPMGRSVNGYELRPLGPNLTEVRAIVQMQPTGLLSRLWIWALRKPLIRATDEALDRLLTEFRRAAEAEAT
ncbi:MAG: SRPBCC family protein [Neomegalonema sp.]|nr:SRPBCC family protein [Neomegalonema sp.]